MENVNKQSNLAKDNNLGTFMFFVNPINSKAKKKKGYVEKRTYYGVNVFKVVEITRFCDIKLSSNAGQKTIMGIAQLRDNVYPLIDLPKWINGKSFTDEELQNAKVLICDFNHKHIALVIAEPYRIEIKSWNEVIDSDNISDKVVSYTKTDETGDICFMVDVERLLFEVFSTNEENIKKVIKDANQDLSYVSKNKPILIAEDSKVAQRYLSDLLKGLKIKFEIFDNGKGLLDKLQSEGMTNVRDYPLIITDLEMPIVSGHKVIQEIRKYCKDIPILVNSSMTGDNNKRDVLNLGATDFIGKTNPKKIVEKIKKYIKDKS